MGVEFGVEYMLFFEGVKGEGEVFQVVVIFIDESGKVIGSIMVDLFGIDWKVYEAFIKVKVIFEKVKFKFIFKGVGIVNFDMVFFFFKDIWMGWEKGLCKDLVQFLNDFDFGFLCFFGGCIVEGWILVCCYQWKKMVGFIEDWEILVNCWNIEFVYCFILDYF